MKKRLFGAILSAALSITMATPAFAEIIWTADKLPAGYTTNEVENKTFDLNSGGITQKSTYTCFIKDMYGNFMKNATFAGGMTTNAEGVVVRPNGEVVSYGSEEKFWQQLNSTIGQVIEQPAWHQDSAKSLDENGISNYWYGTSDKGGYYTSHWAWLTVAPNGTDNGQKYAYCFNEYGYLYTNTITPDGYQVNGLGQLMLDGKVKTKDPDAITPWHGYVSFSIGYLVYDQETSEQHKNDRTDPFF